MRFDGYGATIRPSDPSKLAALSRDVVRSLCDRLNGTDGPGPTMRRFGPTAAVMVGDRLAAWVGAAQGFVYVEGKGETSPALVSALRDHYPDHTAPRVDVCEDYSGPGAFERLQALVRAHKGERVKGAYVRLPDDDTEGRTWAAGVRGQGSPAYLRIYEPGKMKERAGLFALDAVRVELEAHPHYARDKAAAARMNPLEVWGITSWTHRVGEALTMCDLPRYEAATRQYTYDKTTAYIARTFRRHLEEMLSNGEDPVRTFRAIWQEDDASTH